MNDNQYTVEPGERDPVRPPGLFLVLIAMLALGGLGYAIYPQPVAIQSGPNVVVVDHPPTPIQLTLRPASRR